MDLINGKTMYCPECGRRFDQYNGKQNGQSAHVESHCEDCEKYYHWIAYANKEKEHKITMFKSYLN